MHSTSYNKMAAFFGAYRDRFPAGGGKTRVLEIGAKSYGKQDTYRGIIDDAREAYTGLDLEAGKNVDLTPANMYVWDEIADASFDVCISGQTFEHNPFFWVTMCEIARVLSPGGYACIIAPGGGAVHRYPVDCYRFYPDSWAALAALAGLEVEEVYLETDDLASLKDGGEWRDCMLVARKPLKEDKATVKRRAQVTQPFREGFGRFDAPGHVYGPATKAYLAGARVSAGRRLREGIGRWFAPFAIPRIYKG